MTYKSQSVAYPYFVVALLLFALQIPLGLWLAASYAFTIPQSVVDVFPFATARAIPVSRPVAAPRFRGGSVLPGAERPARTGLAEMAIAQLLLAARRHRDRGPSVRLPGAAA
jgi:hypothetical protein